MDAIIIGAGVIGASVALGLSRKGLKALNVDALPAAGYGSTSNSSAVIRPFYSNIENCAMAHEARYRWLNWREYLDADDEAGYARYIECGLLVLMNDSDQELFAPSMRALDAVGIPYEILAAKELERRIPSITMESFGPAKLPDDPVFGEANPAPLAGGLLVPEAGYVTDPQLAAHNLMRAAESLGAQFRFNTKVAAILCENGRASGVRTEAGEELRAPIVVNVAGPHSSKINNLAGVTGDMAISTRALRHEVAHVPAPRGMDRASGAPVITDADTGVYVRSEMQDNMLIGTLDPACDAPEFVDADEFNDSFTRQWTAQVWRAAQRFPELSIPNTAQGVIGLYDATEDWIPIYDKSSLPGYYMAIGTSGNQFKMAPVVGDMMAALITACEAGHDHDEDPVRFFLPHLERTIDTGFFSRNRRRFAEGSGTVLG